MNRYRKPRMSKGTRKSYQISAICALLGLTAIPGAVAEEIRLSESQGVSITIYNQNFGLVRDIRNIKLQDGINYVRCEDVAGHIDPTSVSFQSLSSPNSVVVREQNYQYDLMDQNTILSKSMGKELKFKQFLANGTVSEFSGTLLNSPNAVAFDGSTRASGLVVKTADGIILNPTGQIQIAELPPGLVPKPSLLWKLEANKAGEQKTEIAYQTSGIGWKCDYVALVNKDDDQTDLVSWVTIDNKSGGAYKNAALKLLAGDVHKVQPPAVSRYNSYAVGAMKAAAAEPQFQEQSFAEYHLYTLQGKTNVLENETKQMSLFNASAIPIKKLFVYETGRSIYQYGAPNTDQAKVQVKFELANTEKNHLGIPMPKGKVRVYKKDQDDALQFIGEDEIDHTPRDEKLRLYIGDAFDLVGEHKQVNVERVSDHVMRYRYEISLRNHKKDDVTITAVEHSWGDWKILNSSMEYTKKDSHTFEFAAKVPASGETKITYEIEVK